MNKGLLFSLYGIDMFSKYTFIFPLKKDNTVTKAFEKNLNKSRCKPNKTWDKGSKLYNRSMKS